MSSLSESKPAGTPAISPVAPSTRPALAYYNSGHIKSSEFWRNGTIYGAIFLFALLVLALTFL